MGAGASQIAAGLHRVFGINNTTSLQLFIIVSVTIAATLSLLAGVDKGIKLLSEINLGLALLLGIIVLCLGPTLYIIQSFGHDILSYGYVSLKRAFIFSPSSELEKTWMSNWSIPYWAWWIAWGPFVGIFLARISKGRTIRQFLFGVIIVPTLLTIAWFGIFGRTAIYLDSIQTQLQNANSSSISSISIAQATNENFATAIYQMLEFLPFANITSIIATVVVTIFFITSSDSASYVVDMITSGGHPNSQKWQRIFWAFTEGLIAIVLILTGGPQILRGMQAIIMLSAVPFAFMLILGIASLGIGLVHAYKSRAH